MATLQKSISTPLLVINNVSILYVPNTLSYSLGNPEKNIRTQTSGGGNVQLVTSTNVETQFGEVKFQLRNTAENEAIVTKWINNDFNNAISITDIDIEHFGSNAGITNKINFETGVDGKIEIEFKCNKFT